MPICARLQNQIKYVKLYKVVAVTSCIRGQGWICTYRKAQMKDDNVGLSFMLLGDTLTSNALKVNWFQVYSFYIQLFLK